MTNIYTAIHRLQGVASSCILRFMPYIDYPNKWDRMWKIFSSVGRASTHLVLWNVLFWWITKFVNLITNANLFVSLTFLFSNYNLCKFCGHWNPWIQPSAKTKQICTLRHLSHSQYALAQHFLFHISLPKHDFTLFSSICLGREFYWLKLMRTD